MAGLTSLYVLISYLNYFTIFSSKPLSSGKRETKIFMVSTYFLKGQPDVELMLFCYFDFLQLYRCF